MQAFCLCITACGCELDQNETNSLVSDIKTAASTNISNNISSTVSATSPSSKKPTTSKPNTSKTTSTPKKETYPTVVNKFGNSAANIHNSGFAAEYNGTIYYSTDSGIYKTDGIKTQKLTKNPGTNLCVYNGWLYYLKNGGNRMQKIQTNGKNHFEFFVGASEFYIVNDWIYYLKSDRNKLYRVRIDGTGNRLLLKDYYFSCLNITNDKIYWGNNSITYEANLDGSNVKEYDTSSQEMVIIDNIKYSSGNLTKENIDGANSKELLPDSAMNINVKGDWIYFIYSVVNENEKCPIYKIKTDGTCLTKVSDNSAIEICVVGDWIYYMSAKIVIDEPADDENTWASEWSSYSDGYFRVKIDGTNEEELD